MPLPRCACSTRSIPRRVPSQQRVAQRRSMTARSVAGLSGCSRATRTSSLWRPSVSSACATRRAHASRTSSPPMCRRGSHRWPGSSTLHTRHAAAVSQADDAPGRAQLNARMVDRMKESGAIRSPQIEAAFRATPRHLFLPGVGHDLVYSGQALITRSDPEKGPTSSSSEVFIMGPMLEALAIEEGQRILEIGVGTGYNAALLERLVGAAGTVVSIDVQADVAEEAREHLASAGHSRVRVIAGDGYAGYAALAPYDRIIATASVRDVPVAWRDQLREGGLLVVPMRFRAGSQMVVAFKRAGDRLDSVGVVSGGFMPLRTEHATLERPLTFGGDWELTLDAPREGDGKLLEELLKSEPRIEPFRAYPWQVTFSLIGLVEPDWIVVRQKQRPTTWWGLLDRPSRSVALLWPMPLPLASPRSSLLIYGGSGARDRLVARIDELADVKVEGLHVRAAPAHAPHLSTDIVFEGKNFSYAIDWREVTAG
ncbi:MAG: methyltransferase domain-containing protein [Chloroflexi bacterium]|nr:MAG: methyltransferase domain-containing protein [Chloroflexota bacterium]